MKHYIHQHFFSNPTFKLIRFKVLAKSRDLFKYTTLKNIYIGFDEILQKSNKRGEKPIKKTFDKGFNRR